MVCGFRRFSDRAEVVVTGLPDTLVREITPPINLPSFPALTTLVIYLWIGDPSPRLTNILYSICSAPVLTSVTIECEDWRLRKHPPLEDSWVDVDRWLSHIAKHAEVKGSLALILERWPEGRLVWEGFMPEFRESGGEIKVDYSR